MTDIQLYNKISSLPQNLRKEVEDFVDFLNNRLKKDTESPKRKLGMAKGLIKMKDNFDDPVEDFKDYM